MKISLNWLKDFVNMGNTPEELSALLSAKLTEVEGFVDQAQKYAGVTCVRVEELARHPNSDHLWLVKVFDGRTSLNIVCGAQNLAIGQIVPLISVDGQVPSTGENLKEATIRGQKSVGMLASGKELGLNEDHSGIYILDPKIKPGTSFSKALELNDVIFDIENKALTHRGDCFSHLGIAREVAAITGQKIKNKNLTLPSIKTSSDVDLKITIEDGKDCPRYLAAYLKNIKIGPSPKYIQDRLQACGMRHINNLVDFTNYVMLEIGQPLHAFDASQLSTNNEFQLGVRHAKTNEALTTLDGQKQKLTTDNLVITCDDKPVAAAGVMGGASSEINEKTTAVILEAANFDHFAIRRSARTLGLRTEASLRYEKNLDPGLVELGMATILDLIEKNRVGETVKIVDNYPNPTKPKTIELTSAFINARLGFALNFKTAQVILTSLGLTTSQKEEKKVKKLVVTIPTFRRDLNIPEDLIEEIARIYGYEKIAPQLPTKDLTPTGLTTSQQLTRGLQLLLKELGYSEVYNYSFVGRGDHDELEIINPLSSELRYIRNSLVPGLLANVDYNRHYFDHFKLFEIGKEIHKTSDKTLPEEKLTLVAACYNKQARDPELLFRQAKGDLEVILNKFNITSTDNTKTIKLIDAQTVVFEIDVRKIVDLSATRQQTFFDVPKFPPIIEDLSFFVNADTKVGKIIDAIQKTSSLISDVSVFDVYRNENKKSVALRLTYQSHSGPLSDQDVTPIREEIIKILEETYKLAVRR